jgi:cation transport regulator
MPYKRITELPKDIQDNLPKRAQEVFLSALNNSIENGDLEETAFKKAWAAVKRGYEKKGDEWVKMQDETTFLIPFGEEDDDGYRLYFPIATVYHHGRKVDFTHDRAKQMVANFRNDVPSYKKPISVLHDDSHGIFGYIDDMKLSDKGVMWRPSWRDGKFDEVKEKGYRYMSPEVWFDGYQETYTGDTYDNVALAASMVARPRLGASTLVFSDDSGWGKYMEDDVVRGVLNRLDTIRDLLGRDNINEDTKKEVVGLLESSMDAVRKMMKSDDLDDDQGWLRSVITGLFRDLDKLREQQKERSEKYGIATQENGHLTKPKEWEDVPESQWADPVNWKYPVHDEKRVRAAASYFARYKDEYDPESREVVAERIRKAKEKFGVGQEEDMSENVVQEDTVKRGLAAFFAQFSNNDEEGETEEQDFSEELQEKNAQIAKMQEEQEELEARLRKFEEAKKEAERMAFEERQAKRRMEFADQVKQLAGVQEDFADHLMWLEDADDTDDQGHYSAILDAIKALGNQQENANLFSEAGSDVSGTMSAEDKFQAVVDEKVEQGMDYGEAVTAAARENPELYRKYDAAVTQTASEE